MSVSTRSKTAKMEGTLKEIMETMKAMKDDVTKQLYDMKCSQDDMKCSQNDVTKQLCEMKGDIKSSQDDVAKQLYDMKCSQDDVTKQLYDIKDDMKDVRKQLDEQGNKIDQRVSEIIAQMETKMDMKLESIEKGVEQTVDNFKDEVDKQIKDMRSEIDNLRSKCESQQIHGTIKSEEVHHGSQTIKPPTYDGKTSWQTYMKQFDAAAQANNWTDSEKATALIISLRGEALEILQTLNEDKHKNYEELVLHLEMRFGDKHLQQVYQAQLKGRMQRSNETLQQYEADIARLTHLAYPTAPQDFIEQLAVQIFIDGIRDCETQQALRLARCRKLNEVLAYALEFEAAKQASRGHTRVRQIRTQIPETKPKYNNSGRMNSTEEIESLRRDITEIRNLLENNVDKKKSFRSFGRKDLLECWNCGEKGHIRPRCPRLINDEVSFEHRTTNQENAN